MAHDRLHKICVIFEDDGENPRRIQREYKTVTEGGAVRDVEISEAERLEIFGQAQQTTIALQSAAENAHVQTAKALEAALNDLAAMTERFEAARQGALILTEQRDEAAANCTRLALQRDEALAAATLAGAQRDAKSAELAETRAALVLQSSETQALAADREALVRQLAELRASGQTEPPTAEG